MMFQRKNKVFVEKGFEALVKLLSGHSMHSLTLLLIDHQLCSMQVERAFRLWLQLKQTAETRVTQNPVMTIHLMRWDTNSLVDITACEPPNQQTVSGPPNRYVNQLSGRARFNGSPARVTIENDTRSGLTNHNKLFHETVHMAVRCFRGLVSSDL